MAELFQVDGGGGREVVLEREILKICVDFDLKTFHFILPGPRTTFDCRTASSCLSLLPPRGGGQNDQRSSGLVCI